MVEPQAPPEPDLSWLLDAERGAVAVSPAGGYYVRGTDQVYFVTVSPPACECRGFQIRGRCFHVEAVRSFLREECPCIACDGCALVRLEYLEGRGYRLRAVCQSEGCGYARVL